MGVWCCGGVEFGRILTRSCQVHCVCCLDFLSWAFWLSSCVDWMSLVWAVSLWIGLDWIVGIVGRVCLLLLSISLSFSLSLRIYGEVLHGVLHS